MAPHYGWRPGSRIKIDAQKAGREMENIRTSNDGRIAPADVLGRARSSNSSLHDHFEWDDSVAAEQHRLSQAGELIRSITVDVSRSNIETKPVRAFVSVVEQGEKRFTSTLHAMSDVDLRRQVLERAWAELLAFRQKYGELRELAAVFEAMDRARPAP